MKTKKEINIVTTPIVYEFLKFVWIFFTKFSHGKEVIDYEPYYNYVLCLRKSELLHIWVWRVTYSPLHLLPFLFTSFPS